MSVIYYRHLVSQAKSKIKQHDIDVDIFQVPYNHYIEERKALKQKLNDKLALYVEACDKLKNLK